jgi:hypothetical protein
MKDIITWENLRTFLIWVSVIYGIMVVYLIREIANAPTVDDKEEK